MKDFKFVIRVSGSAKGSIKAHSKKEAIEMINAGQWDDIDIDVEDVIEIEHVSEDQTNQKG